MLSSAASNESIVGVCLEAASFVAVSSVYDSCSVFVDIIVSIELVKVDATATDGCNESVNVCTTRWSPTLLGTMSLPSSAAIEGGSVVTIGDRGALDSTSDKVGLVEPDVCTRSSSSSNDSDGST